MCGVSVLECAAGLEIVERREFGAFSSIRLTVGCQPV
jgi:hypothetical protein